MQKKVDTFEKNVRILLKNQQAKSISLKKMMQQLLPICEKLESWVDERNEKDPPTLSGNMTKLLEEVDDHI